MLNKFTFVISNGFKVFEGHDIPMMEMITLRFQVLLQQTATKVMKHGMHQDSPGLATTNTQDSSVQTDAFPVLILLVVELRRTMPVLGHAENPTATDYF